LKIYTKTGDDGETGLFGAGRVSKDHLRVDAYGQVDELNAAIGLAMALDPGTFCRELLENSSARPVHDWSRARHSRRGEAREGAARAAGRR